MSDAVAEQSIVCKESPCRFFNVVMIAWVGSRCGLYSKSASNSSSTKACRSPILRRPLLFTRWKMRYSHNGTRFERALDNFRSTYFSPGLPTTSSAMRPGVPTRIDGFRFRIWSKLREKVVPPIASITEMSVPSKSSRATLTI